MRDEQVGHPNGPASSHAAPASVAVAIADDGQYHIKIDSDAWVALPPDTAIILAHKILTLSMAQIEYAV